MNEIMVIMASEKETKNTVRYFELADPTTGTNIGVIYIPKRTLKKLGNPKHIKVTIVGYTPDEEL
jgi:hypothetical protein